MLRNALRCISDGCTLDLVTIQGNITGDQYIKDVLHPVVVPHFDNYPLATRPVYMDDNARPHRARAVTAYLQTKPLLLFIGQPILLSHRAYLGHVRPSYAGPGTSCATHSSVGSSIASGMAAAITTGNMTSNWRDETHAELRPSSMHVRVAPGTEL